MKQIRIFALLAPAFMLALSACAYSAQGGDVATTPPGDVQGSCQAAPAQAMIGQKATAQIGADIMARTGARSLRWGPPDTAFTMDYRPDRVNVIYDRAMVITQITCG